MENICTVCGNDYLRCDCESQQPYCEQCGDEECNAIMDAGCVFYHPAPSSSPSLLTCLGIPNNTTVEDILEEIDQRICEFEQGSTQISIIDSESIDLTLGASGNTYTLKADVKISADTDNIISIQSDGIFAENPYKVKVDDDDIPNYLENQIVGATDGIVSISVVNDNHLLEITPLLNLDNLVAGLCGRTSFTACLRSQDVPITPVDTESINLTVSGTSNHTLQADVIISPDVGNSLVINANGLYAGGGDTLTFDNGLTRTDDNVQLGGTLIQDTTIDHDTTYQLNFTNNPKISIGTSNPLVGQYLTIETSDSTINALSSATSRQVMSNGSYNAFGGGMFITGGPFVRNVDGFINAVGGQLIMGNSGNVTLNSFIGDNYSGVNGVIIKTDIGDVTGNILAAGAFQGYAADSGDVNQMAGVRIAGLFDPPASFGANYTGTVANYYELYLGDISASTYAANITNRFAIYQVGTTDISRFFGPVQNSGGGAEFTSDIRVKENITPFTRGLIELDQIDTYKFNYTYNTSREVTGIIAQELEAIIPEAVKIGNFSTPQGEDFTDFRMIDQNVIIYTMFNAIKELSAKVKALESA